MAGPIGTKNLSAYIPEALHDALTAWISEHRDVKIRQCVQAMVEMWLELPEPVQAMLLHTRASSTAFRDAVRQIVREEIDKDSGQDDAQDLGKLLSEIGSMTDGEYKSVLRLLSPAESKALSALRRELSAETPQKAAATKQRSRQRHKPPKTG